MAGIHGMQGSTPAIESQIGALFLEQAEAMRRKDIDALMALYSSDVVYFDTVPPLRYTGAAALRERFLEWFDGWKGSIGIERCDMSIVASADLAVARWLSRASGTLTNGRDVASWVRVTSCCRRSNDGWLIIHEHVSWPVSRETGGAAKDLDP